MAKYVIVGNGVAGMRAAEVVRREDDTADVIILSEESHPFYRRPQLADFASGAVGESRLWAKRSEYYVKQRFDLRLSSKVVALDAAGRSVTMADGGTVHYDKILLATGRRVTGGGVAGSDSPGVNHFKTLDEARVIRDMDGAGKAGLVYGDGLVALELVRALTSAGFSTTYLVPGAALWPEVLDVDAAGIMASRIGAAGAEIVFGAQVRAVDADENRARGLVFAGGDVLSADVVGLCAGYEPALEFLPDAGGELMLGAGYSTQWDGVFAAGDVTESRDNRYFNWLRSWRQGEAAGAAMMGLPFDEPSRLSTLNMAPLGLSLVAIGQTTVAYRSGFTEMRGDYPYGEVYKKLVFAADETLVGTLLLGNIAEAGALEEAIRGGVKKADLPAGLLHQMFDVTYRVMARGVQCPICKHEIQLGSDAAAGDLVTCPICGSDLRLVDGAAGFSARVSG
ncbi:MAG: FAD-dependent oxidoreductase [Actinobacteria bacterium]|nr:FAD-dependent oxidoreductase [Actinomycetota bacterium]